MMLKEHSTGAAALNTAAPAVSLSEIQSVVAARYGIEGTARLLTAERDQNCCIEQENGNRYVFKISNPSESASVVDFQIAALNHIAGASPDLPIPRVVPTLAGRSCENVTWRDGSITLVRMLSYLDGVQIKETERTPGQRRSMATCLAQLNLALHGFSHSAASHDLLWNVSAAHRLNEQLESVIHPDRRRLAEEFMRRFKQHVLPSLPALRSQVIHNDFHLYNVLVAPEEPDRISGIIDFGDLLYAPLVGEVATAAAFHMTGCADPFEGPAEFVGAYHRTLALTEPEQEIVTDLMATRHLITALISEWRAARYPHNRDYILRHNPAAWEALAQMAEISRNSVRDRLLSEIRNGRNK
ncbi:phosphotransferase [Pantoea coffeiphila]|uniref:phosphotransferase n=1 Tax=Pantoea coffeiphila TaxID=1465635 RepID=UPI001EF86277|nr:phosphotransferase [Pantoea coffeiphila]MBM7344257.1 Ser/Thr protein kinase RdoA (MazF antagonist) [Pantoea coffeiphila]